ncbi:uncharacterized protein LOC114711462 [Neltuma alba]|uniref:uncharacterized protein LOC114711462 n=1 Tax=Neltuma alba TaxID=207710 RepID=UPI0010A4EDE5|nr:uncharacterized protein LOC114711462 [Prosopis alba]
MTLQAEANPTDDMEEGYGDTDEVLAASIGISGGFNSVTFNENSGYSGGNIDMRQKTNRGVRTTSGGRPTSSLGVRKKGETMKKKPSLAMKIEDAINSIVEANNIDSQRANDVISRAQVRRLEEEARAYETSIMGVMTHLKTIDEVFNDLDLFARCTQLLMYRPEAQEMYAALEDMREQLVTFLKHSTKNL